MFFYRVIYNCTSRLPLESSKLGRSGRATGLLQYQSSVSRSINAFVLFQVFSVEEGASTRVLRTELVLFLRSRSPETRECSSACAKRTQSKVIKEHCEQIHLLHYIVALLRNGAKRMFCSLGSPYNFLLHVTARSSTGGSHTVTHEFQVTHDYYNSSKN